MWVLKGQQSSNRRAGTLPHAEGRTAELAHALSVTLSELLAGKRMPIVKDMVTLEVLPQSARRNN